MKRTELSVLAGVFGPLILAGSAHAAFSGIKPVHKPNIYGILTWNIYATFDPRPGDFIVAVAGTPRTPLSLNVRGGTFYQHMFGGDTAPNLTLLFAFPSLRYDTFVTIGRKTSGGGTDQTTLTPGFPSFAPDFLHIENGGWFITLADSQGLPNANGQVLLAQLSTQDGTGFFGTMMVTGLSNGEPFQQVVSFDTQQAPAPGSLALVAAAGLLRSRRRRGLERHARS